MIVRPAISLTTSPNTTVQIGYSPGSNCTTLTASATGGTGTIGLSWSNGATGNSTQVCPTATTTYTVTATDAAGCSVQKNVTVTVHDVRCGGNNTGIKICYQGRDQSAWRPTWCPPTSATAPRWAGAAAPTPA